MKPLRPAMDDYIRLRRSLGFKLRGMADDLRNFAAFLEQKAAPYVTTELAMEWAIQPADHQPSDWAQRLVMSAYLPAIGTLPIRARRFPRTAYSRSGPSNVLVPTYIRNRRFRSYWRQP